MGYRFIEKGCDNKFIRGKIAEVAEMDRSELIRDKKKQESTTDMKLIILNYIIQHKQVEKIIKRHWCILLADKHLQEILPNFPKFVYRRAPPSAIKL